MTYDDSEKRERRRRAFSTNNLLFVLFGLVAIVLSIIVLIGCQNPSNNKFQLYSVNGSGIADVIAKNCTACHLNDVPDTYNFGLAGTCRTTNNGTTRCQHIFPNTFNISAAVLNDTGSSNAATSILSDSALSINHAFVFRLSKGIVAALIISIVFNFFFMPIRFLVNTHDPRSVGAQTLFLFVVLVSLAQIAAVVMAYLIMRDEITVPAEQFVTIGTTPVKPKMQIGFWLLVAAAAARPLNGLVSTTDTAIAEKERRHGEQVAENAEQRQQGRGNRVQKTRNLRDTNNVDPVFFGALIAKLASTIGRLRMGTETYPHQHVLDEGCKRLFAEVRSDEDMAFLLSSHFTYSNASAFLGYHPIGPGSLPGPLLWENCQRHGLRMGQESRSRGVYLIVLGGCSHEGHAGNHAPEYRYIGSGRSARGGVMLRVSEHTSPEYRSMNRSELYRIWDTTRPECVAIYLVSEWDPLPLGANPGMSESFDDILLAEAVWQVGLQTAAQGRMSDFTQFMRSQIPGSWDLVSDSWNGCNIRSALET